MRRASGNGQPAYNTARRSRLHVTMHWGGPDKCERASHNISFCTPLAIRYGQIFPWTPIDRASIRTRRRRNGLKSNDQSLPAAKCDPES